MKLPDIFNPETGEQVDWRPDLDRRLANALNDPRMSGRIVNAFSLLLDGVVVEDRHGVAVTIRPPR